MCLSGLKMGVNSVCTLKIDGKHNLLTIFSSRRQKQNATKPLTSRARHFLTDFSDALKFGDVTNM